jgi:hypothetical protein
MQQSSADSGFCNLVRAIPVPLRPQREPGFGQQATPNNFCCPVAKTDYQAARSDNFADGPRFNCFGEHLCLGLHKYLVALKLRPRQPWWRIRSNPYFGHEVNETRFGPFALERGIDVDVGRLS